MYKPSTQKKNLRKPKSLERVEAISNPDFNGVYNLKEEELKRTKHRKTETRDPELDLKPEMIRWRSELEQSLSKLSAKSAAIPRPRRRRPSSPPPPL